MTQEPAALPGLTNKRIRNLASRWNDTGLWGDIEYLADRFLAASDGEVDLRWHHLVLAVGNFKRQGGRRLIPTHLQPDTTTRNQARPIIAVPGHGQVSCDDPESWGQLGRTLRGAGVATTTTLLASLWPDEHVVFDWRVRAVSSALRIAEGLEPSPSVVAADRTGRRIASVSWDDYVTVRSWILTVDAPAVDVERALYELSRLVKPLAGRTWDTYAAAVAETLRGLPTRA